MEINRKRNQINKLWKICIHVYNEDFLLKIYCVLDRGGDREGEELEKKYEFGGE